MDKKINRTDIQRMQEIQRYLDVARIAAWEGGRVLKNGFNAIKRVEWKSELDPVTEFDREAEHVIRSTILAHFPEHEVLGEEQGLGAGNNHSVRWIVDPIDGTANFTRKIPLVAVTIGVEVAGELVVGVVNNPIMDEEYYAAKGMGAYLNGDQIFVSELTSLKRSYVGFGHRRERNFRDPLIPAADRLHNEIRTIRRLGCAALSLAYIACGRMDGLAEICLKPWDVAGGAVILREAGGELANFDGSAFSIYEPTVLAGSKPFLEYLITVFKDVELDFTEWNKKNSL
ncbi:MAG: inositol monophosphatase family protein [Brevinema sp.]